MDKADVRIPQAEALEGTLEIVNLLAIVRSYSQYQSLADLVAGFSLQKVEWLIILKVCDEVAIEKLPVMET